MLHWNNGNAFNWIILAMEMQPTQKLQLHALEYIINKLLSVMNNFCMLSTACNCSQKKHCY